MDDMSLVYNINLCRICQIPDNLDLISTSTVTDEGETYLDLLKFIFNDIPWTEDTLISLACRNCTKKIIDTAEFKNICLESNNRRTRSSLETPVKLENEISENEIITDYDRDELEVEIQPLIIDPACIKLEQFPNKRKLRDIYKSPKLKNKTKEVVRKLKERPKNKVTDEEPAEINTLQNIDMPDEAKSNSTGLIPRFCEICQKQSKNLEEFDRHMHKHTGNRNYICNICGRTYITSEDLKQHAHVHKSEAAYACQICDKKFKTNSNLSSHKKVVHMKKEDYKYSCTQCEQKFLQLGMLKCHIELRHDRIRKFKCDICDKTFVEKSSLKDHSVTHSNVRPFKCELCPVDYKRKDQLNRHKTKQHGIGNYKFRIDKKYDCSYCDKKMSKEKLPRHIRSHTGSKPFSCRLCGMKFGCNSYIKGHVQRKHDIDVHSSEYDTKSYYDVAEEPPLANIAAIIKKCTRV